MVLLVESHLKAKIFVLGGMCSSKGLALVANSGISHWGLKACLDYTVPRNYLFE